MAGYKILQAEKQGIYVLKFIGEIRLNLCSTLDNLVESITQDPQFKTVVVDLTETEIIDSTTLGLLAKIAMAARKALLGIATKTISALLTASARSVVG